MIKTNYTIKKWNNYSDNMINIPALTLKTALIYVKQDVLYYESCMTKEERLRLVELGGYEKKLRNMKFVIRDMFNLIETLEEDNYFILNCLESNYFWSVTLNNNAYKRKGARIS